MKKNSKLSFLISIFILTILANCGFVSETTSIPDDANRVVRKIPTKKQIVELSNQIDVAFIEEIKHDIQKESQKQLDKRRIIYHRNLSNERDSEVYLIGDIHGDYNVALKNYLTIDKLYKEGDALVLFEGYKAWDKNWKFDTTDMVKQLAAAKLWSSQKNFIYDSKSFAELGFLTLVKLAVINLRNPEIFKSFLVVEHKGWDFSWKRNEIKNRHHFTIKRNEEMVLNIEKALDSYNKVIVVAGLMHLPSGEKRICDTKSRYNEFDDYYRSIQHNDEYFDCGTTKPIWDFFQTEGRNFVEILL